MDLKLYITFDCTYDCSFCKKNSDEQSQPGNNGASAMTGELGRKAVDFALQNTIEEKKDIMLSFWGGEPLLGFPVLKRISDYAADLGEKNNKRVFFSVVTNGKIIDSEITDFLKHHSFSVIIHLTDEFFAAGIHEFPDEFKDNYSQFLAIDREPVFRLTLTPGNVNKLYEIVEALVNMGAKDITTEIGNYWDWTEQDIEALNRVYDQLTDFYLEKLRKGEDISLNDIDVRLNNLIRPRRYKYCGAGINEVAVTPDGNIYACLLRNGKFKVNPIGHIDKGFDQEERNKYINYMPIHKESCKGCSLLSACLHDCPVVNFHTTENMNAAPLLLCEREKGLIKNATKFGNLLYQENNHLFMKRFYSGYPEPGGKEGGKEKDG
jgi:uncharacterized protein